MNQRQILLAMMEGFGITTAEFDSLSAVSSFPGAELDQLVRVYSRENRSPDAAASYADILRTSLQSCIQKGLIQILDTSTVQTFRERWQTNRYLNGLDCDFLENSVYFTQLGALIWYVGRSQHFVQGRGLSYIIEHPDQGQSNTADSIHLYLKGEEHFTHAMANQHWDHAPNITVFKSPYPIGNFWPNPFMLWPDAWRAELKQTDLNSSDRCLPEKAGDNG